jgi:GH18 family chitinase
MTQGQRQVSLYDGDFALWLEDVAAKLRSRDFDRLDIDNLVEEIESLGRSDKKKLKSRLVTLLAHLLKRLYIDSAYDNRGWEITIREQRKELLLLLEQSPSLRGYFC